MALAGRLISRFISFRLFEGLADVLAGDLVTGRRLILNDLGEALERGIDLRLASCLATAACLAAAAGQSERAVILYHAARQQPFVANSRWYADVIGTRVVVAAAALAAEKVAECEARGSTTEMWQTARALLAEWADPNGWGGDSCE